MVHFINVLALLYTDINSLLSVDTTNIGICFLVFSNFIFILPLYFFLYRGYILFQLFGDTQMYENRVTLPSFWDKIIHISRIYFIQFFLTLLTMLGSMGFHSDEPNLQLKHMDENSVALLLSVNFVYLICDKLYMKNYLECFLLLYKTLIASCDMSPDVMNGLEISIFMFIIITNTRQDFIHISYILKSMVVVSIITFSCGEYVYSPTNRGGNVLYIILHTAWHIFIGLTYFLTLVHAIRPAKSNNRMLQIETIYCEPLLQSKSTKQSFLDYDEMYNT